MLVIKSIFKKVIMLNDTIFLVKWIIPVNKIKCEKNWFHYKKQNIAWGRKTQFYIICRERMNHLATSKVKTQDENVNSLTSEFSFSFSWNTVIIYCDNNLNSLFIVIYKHLPAIYYLIFCSINSQCWFKGILCIWAVLYL